jgi:hypothetical protein
MNTAQEAQRRQTEQGHARAQAEITSQEQLSSTIRDITSRRKPSPVAALLGTAHAQSEQQKAIDAHARSQRTDHPSWDLYRRPRTPAQREVGPAQDHTPNLRRGVLGNPW